MKNNYKFENKKILKIINEIDQLNLIQSKKFGEINLFSIFSLEILKYLSSSIKSKINNSRSEKNIKFPFVDVNYLNKSKKMKFWNYFFFLNQKELDDNLTELNYFKYLIYQIFNFLIKSKRKVFSINNNSNTFLKYKKNFFNKIYFKKIYFDNLEDQICMLNNFLNNFKIKNNIKNKYFSENFINWTQIFLKKKKSIFKIRSETLVVGSNMDIKNRIMSGSFLQRGKEVLSVAHSNYNTLIYKDPVNEIGEFSFCTRYFTFGNIKFKKKFIKSNYLNPKQIIFFPKKKIRKKKLLNLSNSLYVPNSYNSYRRYGYCRDINDEDYLIWQKKIINSNLNTFIKLHPKSRFNYNSISNEKCLRGNFEIYVDKFDFFIFDVVSQPFFEIAKTNKKILFFDIGLRPLENKILKLLKQRAYYSKIDIKSISNNDLKRKVNSAKNYEIKNFKISEF